MGPPDNWSAKLDELGKRIRAVREAQKPKRRRMRGEFAAAHVAWRMTLELVVGGLIGAAMGWGLDVLLGTRPVFLIVFVLLGMAAGIRTALRSAEELRHEDGHNGDGRHEDGRHEDGRHEDSAGETADEAAGRDENKG